MRRINRNNPKATEDNANGLHVSCLLPIQSSRLLLFTPTLFFFLLSFHWSFLAVTLHTRASSPLPFKHNTDSTSTATSCENEAPQSLPLNLREKQIIRLNSIHILCLSDASSVRCLLTGTPSPPQAQTPLSL